MHHVLPHHPRTPPDRLGQDLDRLIAARCALGWPLLASAAKSAPSAALSVVPAERQWLGGGSERARRPAEGRRLRRPCATQLQPKARGPPSTGPTGGCGRFRANLKASRVARRAVCCGPRVATLAGEAQGAAFWGSGYIIFLVLYPTGHRYGTAWNLNVGRQAGRGQPLRAFGLLMSQGR
jgi:hypothetical protein